VVSSLAASTAAILCRRGTGFEERSRAARLTLTAKRPFGNPQRFGTDFRIGRRNAARGAAQGSPGCFHALAIRFSGDRATNSCFGDCHGSVMLRGDRAGNTARDCCERFGRDQRERAGCSALRSARSLFAWLDCFCCSGPERSRARTRRSFTLDGEDRCERVGEAKRGAHTLPRVWPAQRGAAERWRVCRGRAEIKRDGGRGTACAIALRVSDERAASAAGRTGARGGAARPPGARRCDEGAFNTARQRVLSPLGIP